MGLFSNKNNVPAEPVPAHAHHNTTAGRHSTSSDTSPRRGLFSKRRSSSLSSSDLDTRDVRHGHNKLSHGSTRGSGGMFGRNHEDQSITAARERVLSAEHAEREADRALMQAKTAVKDARDHVKMLEREAQEEYDHHLDS
jgi:hypothetical protein